MEQWLFFAHGQSKALDYAAAELRKRGIAVSDLPSKDVTHLLLPVPCAMASGELEQLLDKLPADITVFGGRLNRPELSGYRCADLLENEMYLARNAQITAYCAMEIAAGPLPVTWEDCPVLIVGYGRIGQCLAKLLKAMGAEVAIAARKESHRAMINALGYDAEDTSKLDFILKRYRVIFNTVPYPVLSKEQLVHCRPDCLKIELASQPGMDADDVIDARGLPGKYAPESSGRLIARTVLGLCARKEAQI